VGIAFLFLFHAPQKLLGWYGGPVYDPISLRGLASFTELIASPLLAVGLFTSWAASAAALEMAGAYLLVHLPRGGWPIENRGELAVLYLAVFIYIAVRGGGFYSLDRIRRRRKITPGLNAVSALAGAAALAIAVFMRGPLLSALPAFSGPIDSTRRGVHVFVTNEESGDLTVIDAATQTVVASAPLGKRPRGIKISPDGQLLYVALSGSPAAAPGIDVGSLPPADRSADGIGEVDARTLKLRRVIRAGDDPEQLDVSADGRRLYVANEDAAQLTVVDVASGRSVASVKVGAEPEGVAVSPNGRVVYVTSEADDEVFVIDTATNTVLTRIAVGHRPRSISFLPDGSRAYVTLENDGAITLIDAVRHRFVELLPLAPPLLKPRPRPMGIAVNPATNALYVTTGSFGRLFAFNSVSNQPTASVPVGQRPWGIALTPDGQTAFTANGPSNDVSVVDLRTNEVVKRIPVGEKPWGIAVAGAGTAP
jgi:YVTN family beta-propeller protein